VTNYKNILNALELLL